MLCVEKQANPPQFDETGCRCLTLRFEKTEAFDRSTQGNSYQIHNSLPIDHYYSFLSLHRPKIFP
jgi:hypothetical protein